MLHAPRRSVVPGRQYAAVNGRHSAYLQSCARRPLGHEKCHAEKHVVASRSSHQAHPIQCLIISLTAVTNEQKIANPYQVWNVTKGRFIG